jgi:hypothetical protein
MHGCYDGIFYVLSLSMMGYSMVHVLQSVILSYTKFG